MALALVAVLVLIAAAGCGSNETDEPPVPAGFYGVTPQGAPADEDFARMADGGIETVRVLLSWTAVDPTSQADDFDFSSLDPIIAGAAEHGVEPLIFLAGIPNWAPELAACGSDCSGLPAPSSPETIEAWSRFAGAASERYGPGGDLWSEHPELPEQPVRTWQIWNEQNSPTFYLPRPDVDSYARLLIAAESEIRRRDPGATVILGGMHATPLGGEPPALTATAFLRELYEVDRIERHFDGVAVHPYAAQLTKVTSQLEAIDAEIARAGDDASLWVTEIGWSSATSENPLARGPEGQAERLTEAYQLLTERREQWNVRAVVWYSWRDRTADPACDWCAYSGLFAEDALEPKPAWEALTAFTGGS